MGTFATGVVHTDIRACKGSLTFPKIVFKILTISPVNGVNGVYGGTEYFAPITDVAQLDIQNRTVYKHLDTQNSKK